MQIELILLNLLGDVKLRKARVSLITRITRLTLRLLLSMRASRLVEIYVVLCMIDSFVIPNYKSLT